MDEKTARKLSKGRLPIDARIDLHGMAERQAHNALRRFLEREWHDDSRIVLVITGKGERSGGILRRAVPRWLAEPPISAIAGSWRQAHPTHGGEGALYVRLRRRPDRNRTPR
ncbi:MAG: Smr/MutS family protein [Pseudomonadota bacterium]|nr:Smr/MutS family protein [Pseudomonadota bacterium]